jgi:hypothetical protein
MTTDEMLKDLPQSCDVGTKKNSKGVSAGLKMSSNKRFKNV